MSNRGNRYAKYTASLNVVLEPAMLAALTEHADAAGRSVAAVIREAIGRYLRDVPSAAQASSQEREARP